MLTSIEGIYRNGKIELIESPDNMPDDTRVIVTFLAGNRINLSTYGIDEVQARLLRSQLSTFAEDWDSPEMDVYDNYDATQTEL
jgi:hypothetical protein